MKYKQKKCAVDLTDLAIGILILGITVSIGARMLILYRDNRLTDTPTVTVTNESISATDAPAGDVLANTWFKSMTQIVNSSGTVIPTTNYSVTTNDFGAATVVFEGSAVNNGTTVLATYDYYNTSDPQWALPNDAAVGLAEYGNWFNIIVIVGIAGLILALIFMAFGRGNESGGVAY